MRKPHGDRLRVALSFPNTYFVGMSNLGLPDDVPAVQRPGRHRLRARLPARQAGTGRAARVRRAARDARVADAGARFRRDRVLGVVRVGLHERPDDAAAGRHAAARGGSRLPPPAGRDRRRRDVREPRAAGAVRRRDCRRRGRVAGRAAGRRLWHPVEERDAAAPGRASAASTSRRSTTSSYNADGTIARYVPRAGHRRAAARPQGRAQDHRGRAIRRRPASSRPTPSSARASWSRWCAAAPTCAASAGPATTTCRCAPSRPIASCSWRRTPAQHATKVGLVSIALCDHPDIEHILRSLLGMGYSISPASLRLDDLTPTIVTLLQAERRADAHDRARDRVGSPAPRHQQDGDQRRDPRPRPS